MAYHRASHRCNIRQHLSLPLRKVDMTYLRNLTLVFCLFNASSVCSFSAWAASAEHTGPSWVSFKSRAGRFSVEMPREPKQTQQQNKSLIGTITVHLFLSREPNGEYTVSYSDLPGFAVKFAGTNTIYDHAKGALLLETLGKEQRYEDVTLAGKRGKVLLYDMPDPQRNVDLRGEAYFFLVEKRLYVIDANVPVGNIRTDANHFLSSFRIE